MIQAGEIADAESLKVNSFAVFPGDAVLARQAEWENGRRSDLMVGRDPAQAGLPTMVRCWVLVLRHGSHRT